MAMKEGLIGRKVGMTQVFDPESLVLFMSDSHQECSEPIIQSGLVRSTTARNMPSLPKIRIS